MSNVANLGVKSEPNKLRCISCGATTEAPCDCGVSYESLTPRAKAAIGLKQTPEASNIAIAKRMGVSDVTVGTVRRELSAQNNFEPREQRVNPDTGIRYTTNSIWDPEKDAKIMEMHKEGKRDGEIAEHFGVSYGAASGRRHRLMNIRPELEEYRLPERMPDDILLQATNLASTAKARMYEIDALSVYVDQMHEDVRQLIAEEVAVVYKLSGDIIRRLVGGTRNIKAPACGVEIKLRKDE